MADPFAYLLANLHKPVTVRVVNGDRVSGLLLSVDDFSNVLLGEWRDASAASAAVAEAGSGSGSEKNGNVTRRKTQRGRGEDGDGAPSIRFIRGSEIKSISLSVAAAAPGPVAAE